MFRPWWLVLTVAIAACTGAISGPESADDAGEGGRPSRSEDGSGSGGPGLGGDGDDGPELPAVTTRYARLTHGQWQNTVVDLLGLPVDQDLTGNLREDSRQSGFLFENQGAVLEVDEALFSGYQRAAAELAERATADDDVLARVSAAVDQAGFIDDFVTRAHRRPVSEADQDAYAALFAEGAAFFPDMDPFAAGARAVIEAALQSPYFLYRVELSSEVSGEVIPLDDYEVASRLSYALWNTMPDEGLFAAAARGELTEPAQVEAEAVRMLDDPRAADMLVALHDQLLDTPHLADISPSSAFYDVSAQLPDYAREEQQRFLRDLLFDNRGTLRDLFTSTETFVNDELAEIYGLSGDYGSRFEKASLDPERRSGVFTHIGFLAANATSVDPDPIHRGKFLAERIACIAIAAPPVNIPPPPQVSDKTNRQRIEELTEAEGSECAVCHKALINPFGFPFESYDAIGAFRTTDRDMPVRTDATPLIDSAATPVSDGVELSRLLAQSEGVHRCYVKHLLEFLYGRPKVAGDNPLVGRVTEASLDADLGVDALIVQLVTSEAFLTRSVEEEQ